MRNLSSLSLAFALLVGSVIALMDSAGVELPLVVADRPGAGQAQDHAYIAMCVSVKDDV